MKNRITVLFILLSCSLTVLSQSSPLTIEGSAGKFYLVHTVVAKENWYSIGRLFNCPPHDIAAYNNLSFDKPLEINQQLNIPLTPGNFDQKKNKAAGETLVPLYHTVAEKEWIFKISSMYNDVPVASLEKWNNVKRDDVKKGSQLIVGFLKVKTDQSPLAEGIASNPVPGNTPASALPQAEENISQKKPVSASGSSSAVPPATSANPGPQSSVSAIQVSNSAEKVNNYAATHSNGGFFSIDYAGGNKSAGGMAGTFKSTSGWSDGKYYALMNSVPVGTILRVSGNGKSIYAKVLGQLPEMKESSGLLIRISNAASAELGLGEGKFPVEVKY